MTSRSRDVRTALLPLAICAAYLGQLALVVFLAHHGRYAAGAMFNHVPGARTIAEIADRLPFRVVPSILDGPQWTWVVSIALGVVQSLGIYSFYRAMRRDGGSSLARAGATASVAVMAVASFALPYASSTDLYAYVGYGLAPTLHASFDTSLYRLPPGFGIIDDIYGSPEVPNVYGAGLYALMSYVRFTHAPLIVDLYILRAICGFALAAVFALLRRRLPAPALWALALCPAMYDDYVLNAHNDIFPILCTVAALVALPKRMWFAVAAVASAATFKLTLLLTGVTLVSTRDKLVERIALAAAMVAVAWLAVHALDGGALSSSISTHVTSPQAAAAKAPGRPFHAALQIAIGLTAVAIAIVAVVWGRATSAGAFALALHPSAYAWYQPWGLAYGALTPDDFWIVPVGLSFITPWLSMRPFVAFGQEYAWTFAIGLAIAFAVRRSYRRPATTA